MSTRSPADPAQPARSKPAIDAGRAIRCTEAVRDIAEDCTVLAEKLMHGTCRDTTPTAELLQLFAGLESLVQEGISALVVRQRSQGQPLAALAPVLNLSKDRLRKKYKPRAVDHALATRVRPPRTTPARLSATDPPSSQNPLRQPRQRLACALSRAWTESGVSQRKLANHMNVDPSYVSRMLSGHRDISWRHAKTICETCGGDLALMEALWEVAAGTRPPTTDPVRHLHTYLQALRYAAGSPSDEAILASAQHTITIAELRQALNGPGVPAWAAVARLTTTLQALPETARPLWRQTLTDIGPSRLPAEAFG